MIQYECGGVRFVCRNSNTPGQVDYGLPPIQSMDAKAGREIERSWAAGIWAEQALIQPTSSPRFGEAFPSTWWATQTPTSFDAFAFGQWSMTRHCCMCPTLTRETLSSSDCGR